MTNITTYLPRYFADEEKERSLWPVFFIFSDCFFSVRGFLLVEYPTSFSAAPPHPHPYTRGQGQIWTLLSRTGWVVAQGRCPGRLDQWGVIIDPRADHPTRAPTQQTPTPSWKAPGAEGPGYYHSGHVSQTHGNMCALFHWSWIHLGISRAKTDHLPLVCTVWI